MELQTLLYTAFSIFFPIFILSKFISKSQNHGGNNLPPMAPGALPVIGHVHLLKLLHRGLYTLSLKAGPIFTVRLGPNPPVVVISSSSLVDECFNKNDICFANRPVPTVNRRSLGFSSTSVIGAPYGDHWRNLRKICDLEVFSTNRLASFLAIRRDEMNRMISGVYKVSSAGFAKVNIETKIVELIFNNIMRMISGKRYYGEDAEDDEEAKTFRDLTKEALELTGVENPGEIFPFLKWFGVSDLEKKLNSHAKKTDVFMEALLDDHRRGKRQNTMVDHLLGLQSSEPEYYTDEIIIGLILAIIIAGTDASVVTAEWIMTMLLNHPEVMERLRKEIDNHVGHKRAVEEHDLPKLRYLHHVVLETLRLFPSIPMLVPHTPSQDVRVGGYDVPKGTMVVVNAWAIHRDPKVWSEPLKFMPERFEGLEVETNKLLPFGMGRRGCPGAGLAQKYVGLAVASLVQMFEWKRMGTEKIDLSEGSGATLVKIKTLEAMCKPRAIMGNVLADIVSQV